MIGVVKQEKYFLIGLFLFTFLIRAFVFHFYIGKNENYWQADSNTYHLVAKGIVQGEGIGTKDGPSFYRLPGYSLFLSLYYKLFETDTKNVLWVQIFLASFIPIFIFFLSLALFAGNFLLARFASGYSAIHLGLVLYSCFFMTESFFIFFFLLFSVLFFSSYHLFFCGMPFWKRFTKNDFNLAAQPCPSYICSGPSFVELCYDLEIAKERKYKIFTLKKLFFAGIFLGIASLIRPVGHYLIVLSVIALFFSRDLLKDKIKKSIVLFIGWFLIVSLWLLRNFLLTSYIFFHTLPGGHFLHFSAARIAMYEQNCSYDQAKEYLRKKVSKLAKRQQKKISRPLNEPELCNLRMELAKTYFRKHPLLAFKHWLTDMLRTSFSLYSAELLYLDAGRKSIDYFARKRTIWSMFARYLWPSTKNVYLRFVVLWEKLTYLFILLGFAFGFVKVLFRRKYLCPWLKVLPFMFLFIIIGLAGGYSRMRLPVEPFLIILSFSSWLKIWNSKLLKIV